MWSQQFCYLLGFFFFLFVLSLGVLRKLSHLGNSIHLKQFYTQPSIAHHQIGKAHYEIHKIHFLARDNLFYIEMLVHIDLWIILFAIL